MSTFIVFKKFKLDEAVENMRLMEKWFRENPRRRLMRTNLGFTVRRGFLIEDVLKRTIKTKV